MSIRKKLKLLTLCACLALSAPILNDYPAFAANVQEIESQARSGNADAQNKLGDLYYFGQGVAKDFKQAKYWFEKAAEQGHAVGQYNLGYLYEHGEGTAKDINKALDYYLRSARQGQRDSQFRLGILYDFGKTGKKDKVAARQWYEKAAKQDHVIAQYNLGVYYQYGEGGEKDYTWAKYWYEKAAAQNDKDAQLKLGFFYHKGLAVQQDFRQARYWYEKSAAQNNSDAYFNLGYLYHHGEGVDQDYHTAREYYLKSANLNDSDAQYNLGLFYEKGLGVDVDLQQARNWYQKSADQGDSDAREKLLKLAQAVPEPTPKPSITPTTRPTATPPSHPPMKLSDNPQILALQMAAKDGMKRPQYLLGEAYFKGKGLPQDQEMGRYWLEQSAAQAYAPAQTYLGVLYEFGATVPKNMKKAKALYLKAAQQQEIRALYMLGHAYYLSDIPEELAEAKFWLELAALRDPENDLPMFFLGEMYERGHGVKQDLKKAYEWYEKAYRKGNKTAFSRLVSLRAKLDEANTP